jgi:hypothetical protein
VLAGYTTPDGSPSLRIAPLAHSVREPCEHSFVGRSIGFTEDELRRAVAESMSWAETLRNLAYCSSGGNPQTIKKYVRRWRIDTSHFDADAARARGLGRTRRPLDEILVRGSTYSRGHLKRRLYEEGIKERRRELCGQDENWNGARISLILDHVNGVGTDNRLENLRIVCPNCAAALPTHCGRGLRKPRVPRPCEGCGAEFQPRFSKQKFCSRDCGQRAGRIVGRGVPQPHLRKVERPPYEQLLAEIDATSLSAVGRKYGVSDNTVRKWVRFYERQIARESQEPGADAERSPPADEAA